MALTPSRVQAVTTPALYRRDVGPNPQVAVTPASPFSSNASAKYMPESLRHDPLLQRLVDAHPALFRGQSPTVWSNVSTGWYSLIDRLCADIESFLGPEGCSRFQVEQIKEKFGSLSFYWRLGESGHAHLDALSPEGRMYFVDRTAEPDGANAETERVRELVEAACETSKTTCEECGAPAQLRRYVGWMTTLCDQHDAIRTERQAAAVLAKVQAGESVLYLDFGGALHPGEVYWRAQRGAYLREDLVKAGHTLFENAALLERLLEPYPEVRIVLSTSWVLQDRYSGAVLRLPPSLRARCVGATYHSAMPRLEFEALPRGAQVMADVTRRRPSDWIAIDDSTDGWPPASDGHVVITDPVLGISAPQVLKQLTRALKRFAK